MALGVKLLRGFERDARTYVVVKAGNCAISSNNVDALPVALKNKRPLCRPKRENEEMAKNGSKGGPQEGVYREVSATEASHADNLPRRKR